MTLPDLILAHATYDDAAILAAYDAQVVFRRVPMAEINVFLVEHFINGRLRLARDNPDTPIPVRAFLGDFLIGTQTAASVDGTNTTIRGAIGQTLAFLVGAQVMTQGEADGFNALLITPNAPVTLADVAIARRTLAIAPGVAAADADVASVVGSRNTFVATAETWAVSGEGEMPVWGGLA